MQLFWARALLLRLRRALGRHRRQIAAEEGSNRTRVDGSGKLAQRPAAVRKGDNEFAAGSAEHWRFKRHLHLKSPERERQTPSSATSNKARQNGANNGSPKNGVKPERTAAQSQNGSELDNRIATLQETVGGKLYRWVLREYGHANQPHLVRDVQQKKKILDVLESATRGLRRMEAVLDRVPEHQVSALLAKLQAPPLNEIADMPRWSK